MKCRQLPVGSSQPPRGPGSSSGGPAGAILTAIPGSRMTLGNDVIVVSVYHRLGHHVPADVAPPPCKCSAGVAAEAHHAIVCEKVAKMTHMHLDNLANALRLVASIELYLQLPLGGGVSLPGPGPQEGHGGMPAPGRHRGGASAV